jgi:nucleoside-diphosphate-sugar epimerase
MHSRRVLLAGVGYVGSRAAEILVEQGYEVFVLRRSAIPIPGTHLVQADLLNPESLRHLPACQHVVYCAAADGGGDLAYEQIYLNGLRNLLESYRLQAVVPQVIFTSSTSVYAEAQGGWVEEATAELVKQGPSRFLVAAEDYLREGPWNATILRFGGIYGPARTSFLQRVQNRKEFLWDGPSLYSNRIHRDDCARVIVWSLQNPNVWGQTLSAVDDDPAERNSLILWMCQLLGINPEELKRTSIFAEIPHRGNKRVSNRRLREAGFEFLYPTYREGYRELSKI